MYFQCSVCAHLLKGQQSSESNSPSNAATLKREFFDKLSSHLKELLLFQDDWKQCSCRSVLDLYHKGITCPSLNIPKHPVAILIPSMVVLSATFFDYIIIYLLTYTSSYISETVIHQNVP